MIIVIAVVMMAMAVLMVAFDVSRSRFNWPGLIQQRNLQVDRSDPVPVNALGRDFVGPLDGQAAQSSSDRVQVHAEIDHCSEEHVAGDPAERIDVQVSGHKCRSYPSTGAATTGDAITAGRLVVA